MASDPPPVDGIKDKDHIQRKEILETAGGRKYFSERAVEIYAIAKVFEEEISRRKAQPSAMASDPPPVDGIKDKEHIQRKEILEIAGGGKYVSRRAAEIYAIAKVFEEEISRRKAQEVDEEQKKLVQATSLRDACEGLSGKQRNELVSRKEILETKYFSERASEIRAIAKVFEDEISRRKAQEFDEEQKKSV